MVDYASYSVPLHTLGRYHAWYPAWYHPVLIIPLYPYRPIPYNTTGISYHAGHPRSKLIFWGNLSGQYLAVAPSQRRPCFSLPSLTCFGRIPGLLAELRASLTNPQSSSVIKSHLSYPRAHHTLRISSFLARVERSKSTQAAVSFLFSPLLFPACLPCPPLLAFSLPCRESRWRASSRPRRPESHRVV